MGCWNRQPDKYFEPKIYEGLDASDVFAGWKIVGDRKPGGPAV